MMKQIHKKKRPLLKQCLLMLALLLSFWEAAIANPVLESTSPQINGSNVTAITITKPTGTTANELLLAVISIDGNNTVTAPSGWTKIDDGLANGNAATLVVYYKIATASEPSDYTFSWSTGEHTLGAIMRYSNVDTSNPIDVVAGITATGNTNMPTAPDITTNSSNTTIVYAYAADADYGNNVSYNPSGTTGILGDRSANSGSNGTSIGIAEKTLSSGATGTCVFDMRGTVSEEWRAITIVLNSPSTNTDTDGDGVADADDLDKDNDGILDTVECPNGFTTGELNTPGYPENIALQVGTQPTGDGTTAILNGLYGGAVNFKATFASNGTGNEPAWQNGIRIEDDATIGKHIYMQPYLLDEFPNDNMEITLDFTVPVTDLSFIVAGLNVYDAAEFTASYQNSNLTINSSNFSNMDPDVSVRSTGTGVIGTGNTGGTDVNSNRATFSITGPVDQVVIRLGKDGGGSPAGTVTTAITSIAFNGCDADNDGIANYFDLDSDGDGCPDALEGGGSFATSNIENDTLTGGVDTDGVPNLAGNSGQTIGTALNASLSTACDADGDGIFNDSDLDKDNDGIVDVQECELSAPSGKTVTPYANVLNIFSYSTPVTLNGDSVTSTVNLPDGPVTVTTVHSGTPVESINTNSARPAGVFLDIQSNPGDDGFRGVGSGGSYTLTYKFDRPVDVFFFDAETSATGENYTVTTNGQAIRSLDSKSAASATISPALSTNPSSITVTANNTNIADAPVFLFVSEQTTTLSFNISQMPGGKTGLGVGVFSFVCLDMDNDNIPNDLDLDSDNDGIPDIVEAQGVDTNGDGRVDYPSPNDPSSMVDLDGDGLADTYDNNDNGGSTSGWTDGTPIANADSDNDGILDVNDLDADNDGIPDVVEAGGTDANGDGRADNFTDTDSDGFNDVVDGDVGNDGAENTANSLVPTGTDTDNDGVPNSYPNRDTDGDGQLDFVDLDADNDGIPDVVEAGGTDVNGDGKADNFADEDNDGFNDVVDGDPNNSLATGDDSADTNTDDALVLTGADTDNDGDPNSYPNGDQDGDGLLDQLDLDADNDGIPDVVETGGIDTDGNGIADNFADLDGDGFNDTVDGDPDNSLAIGDDSADTNTSNAQVLTGADTNNDGNPNSYPGDDKDQDGNLDHLDLDADNDGIPDLVEVGGIDSNGDGQVDNATDVDQDGLADIYDEDATDGPGPDGTNGVALLETDGTGKMVAGDNATDFVDTDGDNLPDHLDLDADNDGVPDLIEAGGDNPSGNGMVNTSLIPWDTDGDGLADIFDTDDNTMAGIGDGGDALIQTTADTDGDGTVNQATEGMTTGGGGQLPINPDNDAFPNHLDIDADNDGIMDVTETGATDSNNDGRVDDGAGAFVDADGDGFHDGVDGDVGNDGNLESSNPLITTGADDGGDTDSRLEYAGNGTSDSDGDDVPDFLDVDSDNDGIFDNYEGQATAGYIPPGTMDTDGDGLLDAYDADNGAGQNGISPYNHNSGSGDTTPDYLDLDSDGDNISDEQEAWDNIADGDSRDDNIPSCNGEDADGDGLLDCFDSNDADPTVATWAGDPADDESGASGTAAGTVFVDDLDVILPDNIGNDPNEPDYRDDLNACTAARVFYGITEASAGTTTSYEYNDGTDTHVDGANTKIIRATAFCEPDADGWFYYFNPLEPENYLFAIKNNASSPNTVSMRELVDYIEIKVAADPTTRHVKGANAATLVMERDWNVVFKGTPTTGSSFDVKFYFRPEEMAALDAAANQVVNDASNPVRNALQWFKKPGGLSDSDISGSGITNMTDITSTDAVGVDETTSGTIDSSTRGNSRNYVEFVGLTSFSGGTAAIRVTYSALPVELSSFTAKHDNCENNLAWITASEKDFSHFEVQKSLDGRSFTTLAEVAAAGGLNSQAYQYTDKGAEALSYYRLKMVDLDGTTEYSEIIALRSDCAIEDAGLILFPNPASISEQQEINLRFNNLAEVERSITITDLLSRVVRNIPLQLVAGENNLQIDISDLPEGTYFLNIELSTRKVITKRFILVE